MKKSYDRAITAYRTATRLKPDFAEAHYNLGNGLWMKKSYDRAITAYRTATRLKPDFAEAHYNLGAALWAKGLVDLAIDAYRKAVHYQPDHARAHNNLGVALKKNGLVSQAMLSYQKAIRFKPDYAEAHDNLGVVLQAKGLVDPAIDAYRKAIQIKPDYAPAHIHLANALHAKGLLDETITAWEKAIRFVPDFAEAYCGLGVVLTKKGDFSEALKAYRRGHELGSRRPSWRYPSGQWVQQAERLLRANKRLSAVLQGSDQPADAAECLDFARLCQEHRQLYSAAVRFYEEAFAANPKIADSLAVGHHYDAACAAARAGCGQGKDAAGLGGKERARLRRQALDWLQADLVAWQGILAKRPTKARLDIVQQMDNWQGDPDLAGVHREGALARLPEQERAAWRQFWSDVVQTQNKARGKRAAEAKTPKQGPRKD
jgi:tetratricopeptide (TPR) repeat protein